MVKNRLIFLAALLVAGCAYIEEGQLNPSAGQVPVIVEASPVKTSISGTTISWKTGDRMGVTVKGIHSNVPFYNVSGNTFQGYFTSKGAHSDEVEYYAYYPYVFDDGADTVITATLPKGQVAPFDPSANYMVSTKARNKYDETQMPTLTFSFNNQLFSLLKFTVTNTNPALTNEKFMGVELESSSKTLSGVFSFNMAEGAMAKAVFSTHKYEKFNAVQVSYSYANAPKLGLGVEHIVYLFVPEGTYNDLSVAVMTEFMRGSIAISQSLTFQNGTLHTIQTLNTGAMTMTAYPKKGMCFGDSITTNEVPDYLQVLLGSRWKIYNAGVTSERTVDIMGRGGAATTYLYGDFEIPATAGESIEVGTTFYTDMQADGTTSETPNKTVSFNMSAYYPTAAYCGLVNPYKVADVDCTISKKDGKLYLTRSTDGTAVKCSGYTVAVPYTVHALGDANLVTCYMGTNGGYNGYSGLTKQYGRFIDVYKSGEFMAVGYHHQFWSATYRNAMFAAFGQHYVDLCTECATNVEHISKQINSRLSNAEMTDVRTGNHWPVSWNNGGDTTHPNTSGHKAYASLVYYRMLDLGLLNEE